MRVGGDLGHVGPLSFAFTLSDVGSRWSDMIHKVVPFRGSTVHTEFSIELCSAVVLI